MYLVLFRFSSIKENETFSGIFKHCNHAAKIGQIVSKLSVDAKRSRCQRLLSRLVAKWQNTFSQAASQLLS